MNCIVAFIIFGLLLPTFLPFAPHITVHAMYDAHVVRHLGLSPHNEIDIDHSHGKENDLYTEHKDIDHKVPIDFASYYKDFLHLDLKNTDKTISASALMPTHDIDYDFVVNIFEDRQVKLATLQKRGPPIGHVYEPKLSSLYLTTLRIRI